LQIFNLNWISMFIVSLTKIFKFNKVQLYNRSVSTIALYDQMPAMVQIFVLSFSFFDYI